jgi:hypothetical protein
MLKGHQAADPDTYVATLTGWRREIVEGLRASVRAAARFEETIKWGNILYSANGPVLMIRAENDRVLFGFWRGKRLLEIEPRLKRGGKYEMATVQLRKGDTISPAAVRRLTRKAAALNKRLGNPTLAATRK